MPRTLSFGELVPDVPRNTFGPVCLRLPNLGGINPNWPVCPGGCPPPYPVRRGILIHSNTLNKREQTLLALYAFVCSTLGESIPFARMPWGLSPTLPRTPGNSHTLKHTRTNTFGPVCLRLPTLGESIPFARMPWGFVPRPTPYTGEFSYTQTHSNKHFWPCMQSAKTWGLSPTCPVRPEFSYTQ